MFIFVVIKFNSKVNYIMIIYKILQSSKSKKIVFLHAQNKNILIYMAVWPSGLRRLIRNQLSVSLAGSNPVTVVLKLKFLHVNP